MADQGFAEKDIFAGEKAEEGLGEDKYDKGPPKDKFDKVMFDKSDKAVLYGGDKSFKDKSIWGEDGGPPDKKEPKAEKKAKFEKAFGAGEVEGAVIKAPGFAKLKKNQKLRKNKKGEDVIVTMKPKKKELRFDTFIHRVLKQVHPHIGITKQGMTVMNDLVCNAFYQISEEAGKLVKMDGRDTLFARDVNCAVRLILPGELAQHSNDEGQSALKHFETNSKKAKDQAKAEVEEDEEMYEEEDEAGGDEDEEGGEDDE